MIEIVSEFLPITKIFILLAELAKGEEFGQYADNWRVILSSQFLSEVLAEIVIEDIESDLFEILTDHAILI